jgi:hypothetical protein
LDEPRISVIMDTLDPAAAPFVRPTRVALRDQPRGAGGTRRAEQDLRPVCAQAVGERELAVEVPEVAEIAERGHLVDDRLRARAEHGPRHRRPVEPVDHHRLRTRRAESRRLLRRARGRGHVVAAAEQQRNQPLAHCTRPAGQEDLHGTSLRW